MISALAPFLMEPPSFLPSSSGLDLALFLGRNNYTISWISNGFPHSRVCSMVSVMGDPCPAEKMTECSLYFTQLNVLRKGLLCAQHRAR